MVVASGTTKAIIACCEAYLNNPSQVIIMEHENPRMLRKAKLR